MEFAEANHALLTEMTKQLQVISQTCQAQLTIAEEYKKTVGDPLRHGVWFLRMLRNTVAFIVGALLTGWGLVEIFNTFFMPKR